MAGLGLAAVEAGPLPVDSAEAEEEGSLKGTENSRRRCDCGRRRRRNVAVQRDP